MTQYKKLKKEMLELLNQFEYVDKSYQDDDLFGKKEHIRQLRKIYNKMNYILENNYKNIPEELEKCNKNTQQEQLINEETELKQEKSQKNKRTYRINIQ